MTKYALVQRTECSRCWRCEDYSYIANNVKMIKSDEVEDTDKVLGYYFKAEDVIRPYVDTMPKYEI